MGDTRSGRRRDSTLMRCRVCEEEIPEVDNGLCDECYWLEARLGNKQTERDDNEINN